MRRFYRLTCSLLISCLLICRLHAQPINRQPVVVLAENRDEVSLQGNLAFFRDSSRQKTIQDICRLTDGDAFQPVRSPVPNFGVITGTKLATPIWLRFRLHNASRQPQAWLTEIDFWCFDELQLFIVDPANQVLATSATLGWKTPQLSAFDLTAISGFRSRSHRGRT